MVIRIGLISSLSPIIKCKINGEDININLKNDDYKIMGEKLESFRYEENDEADDLLTFVISDPYLKLGDHRLIQERNEIKIRWGYPGYLSKERTLILKEPEYDYGENASITVNAFDPGSKLHGRSEQKTWNNIRYSQIAEDIAEKHQLKTDIEQTEQIKTTVPQQNLSDFDFLKKIAASQVNYEFYIENNVLHFHKKRKNQVPDFEVQYFGSKENYLKSFRVMSNTQRTKAEGTEVTAVGFDQFSRQSIFHKANNQNKEGLSLDKKTLMVNQNKNDTLFNRSETGHFSVSPHDNYTNIKNEAEFLREQKEDYQTEGELIIVGYPYLVAKKTIKMSGGIADKHRGLWYIKQVISEINTSGYITGALLQRDSVNDELTAQEHKQIVSAKNKPLANEDLRKVNRINLNTGLPI